MDLKDYITPLLRWWWLLIVASLVAATSSYLATRPQPPIYSSRTTLMIGRAINDPNPTSSEFYLGQQLASTYADIANREPVRNATKEALGIRWLPQYLAKAIPNTQMIEISVSDTDPTRAQAVANELAQQLILRSPTSTRPEDQERQNFVNKQLDNLQMQIEETELEIQTLQEELGSLDSARLIAQTRDQIATLEGKLTTLQSNYADLLSNTQQGAVNTLTVLEQAELPTRPIGPNKTRTIALATATGLALAAFAAYVIEYLDDTIKTVDDVSRVINKPVIGLIPDVNVENNVAFIIDQPRSPVADAFRSLRTNLEFSSVDQKINTLVISSPDATEGKSTIVVNLAIALAQVENKVLILDADLRRGKVHQYLGLQESPGLSEIFRDRAGIFDAIQYWDEDKNLAIIPSGILPPNPSELLGSKKMDSIITDLKTAFDMVLIDGPPFFVADALLLGAKADGVLLTIHSGRTKRGPTQTIVDQIDRSGINLIGIVLNRVPRGAGYYTSYYGKEYYSQDEKSQIDQIKTSSPRIFSLKNTILKFIKEEK